MTRKLNKKGKIAISILALIFALILVFILYNHNLKAVSKESDEKEFSVEIGENYYTISKKLKKEGLIRSEFFYKIYIKTHKISDLKEGVYLLNKNMNIKKIIETLNNGAIKSTTLKLTFQEGLNIRKIANLIEKNTNNKEADVYNLLKNKTYIKSLIDKYWFLTKDIQNEDIYYPLEGYLFPNTYEFLNKDISVDKIFEEMLNETEKQLEPLKEKIKKSKYSVHEILTLASIVELEATHEEDRYNVAGILYNRLNNKIKLGSDVTTYYGLNVGLHERDLKAEEIEKYTPYNTRSDSLAGKLPVGPVCNPSIQAIKAALTPKNNNYYYFVADKNGEVYYTKTYAEHQNKINELKEKGLWYNY